jgi:hypothetical protein
MFFLEGVFLFLSSILMCCESIDLFVHFKHFIKLICYIFCVLIHTVCWYGRYLFSTIWSIVLNSQASNEIHSWCTTSRQFPECIVVVVVFIPPQFDEISCCMFFSMMTFLYPYTVLFTYMSYCMSPQCLIDIIWTLRVLVFMGR